MARRWVSLAMVLCIALACGCSSSGKKATATDSSKKSSSSSAASDSSKSSSAAGGGATDCPSDAAVSAAIGVKMAIDSEGNVLSVSGFCPYKSTEDDGDITVSITFTKIDVTQDDGSGVEREPVSGLGQRALWASGGDELTIWTGDQGIIVSVLIFGSGPDEKDVAIKVAKLVV